MTHTVTITEEDRQLVLLALALMTVERPGFTDAAGRIADSFAGRTMFTEFRALHADSVRIADSIRVWSIDEGAAGSTVVEARPGRAFKIKIIDTIDHPKPK